MKKNRSIKTSSLTFFFVILLSFSSWGQIVSNGDLELWTGSTPDDWTTIDGGITTAHETTEIHEGISSANIDVTTGSQASTDFRQSVSITSGNDYHVSVWIKHTEGHMKARLYIDGYQGYSDNSNTSTWQEMTYDFTASSSSIEVGLRFYDQSGFDGAEIVYVDDFTITDLSSSFPTITVSSSMSDFGQQCLNTESAEQSYTVEGSNLTNDITITAPNHFEISTTSGSGYTSPITLTQSGGTVSSTTIYVHFKPTASGAQSENISHSSTGATTVNENVTGTGEAAAIPTVTTTTVSNITSSSASSGGNVTDDNCSSVTARGVCWNTSGTPTIADDKTTDGSGFGSYTSSITGLSDGTTYYVRAYATNGEGTGYGSEESFVAQDGPCVEEGFDSGTTAPPGWTFTGIGGTYTTSGNFGNSAPSIKFDDTGDVVETESISTPNELSFWIKGMGTNATSALLVEGWDGSWNTIDNITGLPTTGTTKTYNTGLSTYTKFRFSYTKSAGNLAFDDVVIHCTSCSGTAPTTQSQDITFTNITFSAMDVNWTNGNGNKRVVIMNTSNLFTAPSDGDDPSANSTWQNSGQQVVYNGSGSTVSIDGLDESTIYWFRVYEVNCSGANTLYLTPANTNNPNSTTTLACADPTTQASDITFSSITETTMNISWTLGNGDGRLIKINTSNSFTAPTDGTTYTANTTYGGSGEQIIYVGAGNTVSIDGLTAGTIYWFAVYESQCSGASIHYMEDLSSANNNPVSQTTTDFTTLERGDIAVVAVCSVTAPCGYGSGGDDEVSFICFKDIKPGTTIDLTDNGWERCHSNQFGNAEGYTQIKRTGATILAGTVITIRLHASAPVIEGVFPDSDWSVEIDKGTLILNSNGDQIYFMQNGTWDDGTSGNNNATYTGGEYIFAFNTNDSWTSGVCSTANNSSGAGRSQNSGLIAGMDCVSMMPGVAADFLKYTGPTDSCSQIAWIGRINDSGNWTSYADCATYYAGAPDYTNGDTLPINNVGVDVAFNWYGNKNTDWFDCANWGPLKVPTANDAVIIPNSTQVDTGIVLLAGETALCKSFEIKHANYFIKGEGDPTKVLDVKTYFKITRGIVDFDDEDNSTTDGTIKIGGNWINDTVPDAFIQGNSTVVFNGISSLQRIYSTDYHEHFGNLKMNNGTVNLNLNGNNISIDGTLNLLFGDIITGNDTVFIKDSDDNSIINYSTNSYIYGNLCRFINTPTGNYNFPVGSSTQYELANINITSNLGINELTASFTNPVGTTDISGLGLSINSTPLTTLLDYGFWTIKPDAGTATYDVTITSRGHSNGGSDPAQHTIIKRDDASVDWATYESNHDNATQSGTGTNPITAKLTGMNGFSDFAIARNNQFPLPISLLFIKAKLTDNNVNIEWATNSEINNEFFTIEKTKDYYTIEKVATVSGMGNSSSINNYSSQDYTPFTGTSYYRIRQTDYNGESTYSKWVQVNNNSSLKLENTVYYSKISNSLRFKLNPDLESVITISTIQGSTIYKTKYQKLISNFNINLDQYHLPDGVYLVSIISHSNIVTKKFVIKK